MALREWLRHWQFWWLELGLLLAVVTTLYNWRALAASLGWRGPTWVAAAGLALVATLCAFVVPPRTNRIYYDEQIYQSIGMNLAHLRLAQMCNHGNIDTGQLQCVAGEYNKQPYAYPHLLSVIYRWTGVGNHQAQTLNSIVFGLAVFVLILVVSLATGDVRGGFLAGLALCLTPENMRWAATAAVEPTAAFFCLLAVLAAIFFRARPDAAALFWVVTTTCYAAQFRTESILIVPLVAALVVGSRRWRQLSWRACFGAGILAILLLVAHLGHLFAVRQEGWGTTGDRMSAAFVGPNLLVNGWFYLWDERFPPWYTVAAVVGLAIGSGRWRDRGMLAGYFLIFWATFLFFYAGSYNYGADVRYSLMTYPPLAALAGLGLSAAVVPLGVQHSRRASIIVAAAMVWAFAWFLPAVRAEGEEAWGARADVAFAREVAATIPANSLVLTHNPGMFHLLGRNAAQMSLATEYPSLLAAWRTRYGERIYLHWNFWCNVADPAQQKFCHSALDAFPSDLVREHTVRDYRFAFYQLRP